MNNLRVFRIKEVPSRYCSDNNNNGKITEEIVNENNGPSGSYEQDIKSKILQSSLPYVPQHGWSRDTVAAGMHFKHVFDLIMY